MIRQRSRSPGRACRRAAAWPLTRGPMLARLTGATFLVLAVLAPFQPWLLPGIAPPGLMEVMAYR